METHVLWKRSKPPPALRITAILPHSPTRVQQCDQNHNRGGEGGDGVCCTRLRTVEDVRSRAKGALVGKNAPPFNSRWRDEDEVHRHHCVYNPSFIGDVTATKSTPQCDTSTTVVSMQEWRCLAACTCVLCDQKSSRELAANYICRQKPA